VCIHVYLCIVDIALTNDPDSMVVRLPAAQIEESGSDEDKQEDPVVLQHKSK
jgi:hypothetical protein